MRLLLAPTAAALLAAAPAGAQTREVPVCPSRADAQMVMQAGPGASLPEGCRIATVRRLDTPAGPVCVIDIGGQQAGIVGAVRDAVATTEWWTACANLRAP
jgi:hypothetical protein